MLRGGKQREFPGPTKDALESAEAGYVTGSIGPSSEVRASSRRVSNKFAKRRKSANSTFGLGPAARARFRRFLLKTQKHPRQLWLFTASILAGAIFLGTLLVVLFLQYYHSGIAIKPDFILSTRTMTNHTPTMNLEIQYEAGEIFSARGKHRFPLENTPEMKILIDSILPHQMGINLPSNDHFNVEVGYYADFEGLQIAIFEENGARRNIVRDDREFDNSYRDPDQSFDDDVDAYYFKDDDYLRGLDTAFDLKTDEIDKNKVCRKIAEHELNFQNCNEFHQLDRLDLHTELKYLNAGAYREVFSMLHSVLDQSELVAVKDIGYDHDMKHDDYEFVRMDAIVAERLSASPRTYDIYGFCGIGILSEYFYHGDIEFDVSGGRDGYMKQSELHDENGVQPQNNLSGIQKLVMALEMAEALADLHGYATGLIVHDDVQLSQYLFNKDQTRLKLNDFNRAEFPLFDEENNEYCHYANGKGHGNWRAPEEYEDKPLTEQIDVWSLGNNMYTLLTGLNPLYEVKHESAFVKKIVAGETAFIDPRYKMRSKSESKLAELIPRCFRHKPEDRPSIFDVVAFLKSAVAENLNPGMTREKVLQGIRT